MGMAGASFSISLSYVRAIFLHNDVTKVGSSISHFGTGILTITVLMTIQDPVVEFWVLF